MKTHVCLLKAGKDRDRDDSETERNEGQLHSMEAVKRRITLCSSPARFFNMILADI